jgi:hypothetical protein
VSDELCWDANICIPFYSGSANAPSSAAAPGPSSKDATASKSGEGKVSQAMLAKDAQTDAMLYVRFLLVLSVGLRPYVVYRNKALLE